MRAAVAMRGLLRVASKKQPAFMRVLTAEPATIWTRDRAVVSSLRCSARAVKRLAMTRVIPRPRFRETASPAELSLRATRSNPPHGYRSPHVSGDRDGAVVFAQVEQSTRCVENGG